MPRKQNTAAKRARAAARSGAKYTTALRTTVGSLPPDLPVVDEDALTDGERLVVENLRSLAASDRPLPVRVVMSEQDVVEAERRVRAEGRRPQWQRCAVVEAAVDGYVLREVLHGPNGSQYIRDLETPQPQESVQHISVENTALKELLRQLAQDNRTLEDRLQAARSNTRFLDRRISQLEAQHLERDQA
ncbi:hypothetical protein ABT234_25160 [Streptomyces sp. NPDC001586]|uniref:hypothetical protein n=1 Tax=Streptomyces sp. NPDC001586 TaxID=3154387 RepID=UPI003328AB6B